MQTGGVLDMFFTKILIYFKIKDFEEGLLTIKKLKLKERTKSNKRNETN
jgi:hypothetical protein